MIVFIENTNIKTSKIDIAFRSCYLYFKLQSLFLWGTLFKRVNYISIMHYFVTIRLL